MNDQSYLALTGALALAQAAKAALAGCVMHLFKQGFGPSPNSTLADFVANEADYDGYAALTIATWNDPVLAGVGYATYAPTQTFRFNGSGVSQNNIAGYFLVTSGGVLHSYTVFGSAVPMAANGQAVIKTAVEVFQAG